MGTPSSHHVLHHVAASPLPLQPRDREPKLVHPGQNRPLRSATGASARITRSLDRAIARTRAQSSHTELAAHDLGDYSQATDPTRTTTVLPGLQQSGLSPVEPAAPEQFLPYSSQRRQCWSLTKLETSRRRSQTVAPLPVRPGRASERQPRQRGCNGDRSLMLSSMRQGHCRLRSPPRTLDERESMSTVNARVPAGASPNDHDRLRVDRKITVHGYRSGGSPASRSSPAPSAGRRSNSATHLGARRQAIEVRPFLPPLTCRRAAHGSGRSTAIRSNSRTAVASETSCRRSVWRSSSRSAGT